MAAAAEDRLLSCGLGERKLEGGDTPFYRLEQPPRAASFVTGGADVTYLDPGRAERSFGQFFIHDADGGRRRITFRHADVRDRFCAVTVEREASGAFAAEPGIAILREGRTNYMTVVDLLKLFEGTDTRYRLKTERVSNTYCYTLVKEPRGVGETVDGETVSAKMMKDFGWAVSDADLKKLNQVLSDYSITDMRSIRLFMATCAHESGFGAKTLESLNTDGTVVGSGYGPNDRGAGYIQITTRDTHLKFLEAVEDDFTGIETANYIAEKYPWEAAAWFWSIFPNSGEGSLNNYVSKYGSRESIFLLTQLWVNGWPRYADGRKSTNGDYMRMPNDIAVLIRDGKIQWSISNGVLNVGNDEFVAPHGWSTPITGRKKCYESAISFFK